MKKVTLIAAVIMTAFTTNAFAQDGQTASIGTTASAQVIKPIAIGVTGTLNFGDLIGTTTGGTVTVSPAGVRSSSVTDLINTSNNTGTITVPTFKVTGEEGYGFAVVLPASPFNLTDAISTETMSVGTFTENATTAGVPTIAAAGTEFQVGATVTLSANQAAGLYESAANALSVTVYYN